MRKFGFLIGVVALAVPGLALAQSARITPGQWDIASTVTSVDLPGAPPQIAKAMTGRTTRVSHCVTPEDAERGLQQIIQAQKKSCSFPKYVMTSGRYEAEMVCKEAGGTMSSTSSGTYTPTGFNSTARSVMTTPSSKMTIVSTSVGKRVGECKK